MLRRWLDLLPLPEFSYPTGYKSYDVILVVLYEFYILSMNLVHVQLGASKTTTPSHEHVLHCTIEFFF